MEINGHSFELLAAYVVKGDPVGKQRHRDGKNGSKYTPQKTRDYQHRIAWMTASQRNLREGAIATKSDAIFVNVRAMFARPNYLKKPNAADGLIVKRSKPDADNILKAVNDGIAKSGVMPDDAYYVGCQVFRYWVERGGTPRTEIEIYRIIE